MSTIIDGTTGVIAPTGAIFNGIASGTAVASTSGTSISFTSIPSWVKRVTVMFKGVSFNASAQMQVQIGSGSTTTSGYAGSAVVFTGSAIGNASFTSGFVCEASTGALTSATLRHGQMVLALEDTNTWTAAGNFSHSGTTTASLGGGSIVLGGTLDRIVITTIAGTATFTAGSINILYE